MGLKEKMQKKVALGRLFNQKKIFFFAKTQIISVLEWIFFSWEIRIVGEISAALGSFAVPSKFPRFPSNILTDVGAKSIKLRRVTADGSGF